jgi:hypothetical protein
VKYRITGFHRIQEGINCPPPPKKKERKKRNLSWRLFWEGVLPELGSPSDRPRGNISYLVRKI